MNETLRSAFGALRSNKLRSVLTTLGIVIGVAGVIAVVSVVQVVLGFVIEGGRSRWLFDHEIAAGVVEALTSTERRSVMGTTRPWSARP